MIGSEGVLGRDHRGLGPGAAAAALQGLGRRALRQLRGRGARRAGARPVRPPSLELPPARPRRGRAHRRRPGGPGAAGARLRVGRPSARGLARARASSSAATTAARCTASRRTASAASPRAPGATPSSRRPTCATRSWRRASSPRPSRPRSPGTASTASWRRSREAARTALGDGVLTCRLTHAYPDGAAPYFTVLAPARRGSELEQWAEVKAAASEAILNAGGHGHAPPRGRARPPALVRPPAPGAVRGGAAGGQGGRGPRRDPQSRGAAGPGALSIASATSSGRTR